jgi:hypothetical protein
MRLIAHLSPMNRAGHAKTLVAAHPENVNALKAGVFSPRVLEPRAQELEAAMADRDAREVALELLRRELAALAGLGEAMDSSFYAEGIRGRGGEPRTLVGLRLRLNEKLRRTIEQYLATFAADAPRAADGGELMAGTESLPDTIARMHRRKAIGEVTRDAFDVEIFLEALLTASDEAVSAQDRLRARDTLSRWQRERSAICVCSTSLPARDAIEFRDWVDEARECVEPDGDDDTLAAVVRAAADGDVLQPPLAFRRTLNALSAVVTSGDSPPGGSEDSASDRERHLWRVVLADDIAVEADARLRALLALERGGALQRCTCRPKRALRLAEVQQDDRRARIVRLVAQRHYRAARTVARFPATSIAVQEAIDRHLVGFASQDGTVAGRAEPR